MRNRKISPNQDRPPTAVLPPHTPALAARPDARSVRGESRSSIRKTQAQRLGIELDVTPAESADPRRSECPIAAFRPVASGSPHTLPAVADTPRSAVLL